MAIPVIWSDLHFSISTDARGGIRKATNIDAVITSVANILTTSRGSRVMLPEFGAGMDDLVGESTRQDRYDRLADKIKTEVEKWDDRVAVEAVDFTTKPDSNQLSLKISLSIRGYEEVFQYALELMGD